MPIPLLLTPIFSAEELAFITMAVSKLAYSSDIPEGERVAYQSLLRKVSEVTMNHAALSKRQCADIARILLQDASAYYTR